MGSVCYMQDKLEEALALYEKSLDIFTKAHGPEHTSVATTCSNMAKVFTSQGKCQEALAFLKSGELRKTLDARRRRS